jgi:hypothetical protein
MIKTKGKRKGIDRNESINRENPLIKNNGARALANR